MIAAVRSFLYGATPVSFRSQLSLSESVARLQGATKRSVLGAFATQEAVGKVSEQEVVLQRVIPFVGNSFKPYFIGRFEQGERGVMLVGHFTMHWSVKVFITIWLGFCLLWTVVAARAVMLSDPEKWYFPLFGLGMLLSGVLLVHVGKWFSRNDAAWISRVIETSLSGTGAA